MGKSDMSEIRSIGTSYSDLHFFVKNKHEASGVAYNYSYRGYRKPILCGIGICVLTEL